MHAPDLFDGRTFRTIDEGLAFIHEIGIDQFCDHAVDIAVNLPAELVYAGLSFGVLPAQRLAQTRRGARGALLFSSCLPISGKWAFGPWPDGVAIQIHAMDNDPIFMGDGDIDAAREIAQKVEKAELFLYPGDQHLFVDNSLPSYDADATALLTNRAIAFLDRVGSI